MTHFLLLGSFAIALLDSPAAPGDVGAQQPVPTNPSGRDLILQDISECRRSEGLAKDQAELRTKVLDARLQAAPRER